jgi:precorrin-6B methylase 2
MMLGLLIDVGCKSGAVPASNLAIAKGFRASADEHENKADKLNDG